MYHAVCTPDYDGESVLSSDVSLLLDCLMGERMSVGGVLLKDACTKQKKTLGNVRLYYQ